jgi:hypothetical protein
MSTLPNILFYSRRPEDNNSREILNELDKNKILRSQFLFIDVDREKVPEKIKSVGIIPLLITNGINKPIVGDAIITLLKNGRFQNKSNGYLYGDLDSEKMDYSLLGDDFKPSDYNQFHNKDYNLGFKPKDDVLKEYTLNNENKHIELYDSSKDTKLDSKNMKNKLNNILSERSKVSVELPFSIPEKFIHSQPNNTSNTSNTSSSNNPLKYNPNVYSNGIRPSLPFPINKPPYINGSRNINI